VIHIRNESVRQLTIAAVQLIGVVLVYLFLRHFYVPLTGIVGGLVWLAACLLLAFWMDGAKWPWRFVVAVTSLMLANCGLFFVALKYGGTLGLLATVPFLFFGHRLANVIDAHALNHR